MSSNRDQKCEWATLKIYRLIQGIDGVLYTRVIDPYKAAYNIEAPLYAVSQLAQT